MKATVVVDNIKNDSLSGEWGLCIYIDYEGKKYLLDTGASNLFLENAKGLNCDISQVDYAVLSHAHYDHANGMEGFFKSNTNSMFYLQKSAMENCYFKKWIFTKYIGIPKNITEKYKSRIKYIEGTYQLDKGVYIVPHTTEGLDKIGKREMMYQKINGRYYPDNFSHEQSLVFETDRGLVIFNSCSHGGAVNIINEVSRALPNKKVYGLIGGFHLANKPEGEVRTLAENIKSTGIEYVCTGHCSGVKAYNVLKDELGDVMHQLHVGLVMEF